ncbi:hypothetical protein [Natronorarus salvus]|uniref:hypothetical protein n=1 Tax=Natronorarus salvus TaxID=3117733 RepID=UPI002F267080
MYLDEQRSNAVLIEPTGIRKVYCREGSAEDYEEQFTLTDSQVLTLGLLLVGAYYQPIAGQISEETAGGEHIRWYSVTEDSGLAGSPKDEVVIEEETETVLFGLERDGEVRWVVEDDVVFDIGDCLIVIGSDDAHQQLELLLESL